MGPSPSCQGIVRLTSISLLVVGLMAALASLLHVPSAAAQDIRTAIEKANLYIEVAKRTERAVESWDRYISWVNVKTGPTGKERYISYGMYEVYDMAGLLTEAREVAGRESNTPKLDATMKRYMDAYEALAPVMNRANAYYERKGYRTDGMAEGRTLHIRMMPLVSTFLADREAMLHDLRPFVREVERQEVAAIEAREGRSRTWQATQIMHAANRVVDLFPRTRPTPMNSDMLEEKLKALSPNTSGEKFDEIIAGVVKPAGAMIDMKQFDAAIKEYAEAVELFDRFSAENPEKLEDFKDLPRRFLNGLRGLQQQLARSQGRDFDGSEPRVGHVVQIYFSMLSASSPLSGSQLRFLQ